MSNMKSAVSRRVLWASNLFALTFLALLIAPQAAAQRPVPFWSGGTGGEVKYQPVAWPSEGQWIAYTNGNATINDPRTNDPSHGGARPQARVNVSSGCPDKSVPSVYYYYDATSQVIFYRWRVESEPNAYAKGPAPGAYSSTDPWLSGQWTVLFDTNGDGFRDYAAHLNGSSGDPANPLDILSSIWSQQRTNSIDYIGDPDIYQIFYNPTGFVQGSSGSTNNQILQFGGLGVPSTTQWPNGASETYWDYGTTRAINISTSTCQEYYVDYQIPVAMLNAAAKGGPTFTGNTPFAFVFATANSLNDPFQKDVVLNGGYVCPPTAPAPFGDPLTLNGGIIEQAIVTSIAAGAGSCNAIPLTAQILDTLYIVNCQTITTLVTAQFVYYYDVNGDGMDNDGGQWIGIAQASNPVGTTVQASWDISNLVRGNYLVALELTDNQGNVTRSYLPDDIPGGTYYANLPDKGITPGTYGVNYIRQVVGGICGAPPPTMTKSAFPAPPDAVAGGGNVLYTLSIVNDSSTTVTVSQISDTLPNGFAYASDAVGTLGAATSSPTLGATGTINWTFSPAVTIPGVSTRTFLFNATAGSSNGTFYNSAVATTNLGTITGNDTTGVIVKNARAALTKSSALATAPGTPTSSFTQNDVVRFTINYSNTGDETITSAVLSDPLPAGFTYVTASPTPFSAPAVNANGTVTWNLGNLAVGASGFVTVDATAIAAGAFNNTATLTGGNLPATQATKVVNVAGPVLEISKTANKSVIVAGQQLVYTITYANSGQATATGVVVSDPIPAGFTYVSASPAPTSAPAVGANGTVTWSLGDLLVGGSGAVTVTVTAPATFGTPTIANTATITSTNALTKTSTYTVETLSTTCTSTTYYPISTLASISSSGFVTGVTITNGGTGYDTAAPPTVTIAAPGTPGGRQATAVARVAKTGTGGAPVSVIGIDIIDAGYGYASAPVVTIAPPAAGVQATATAAFGTSHRTLTTTAPAGVGTATPTFTLGAQAEEIVRFYTDPPDPTKSWEVSPITTLDSIKLIWYKASGNKIVSTVKLVAFDPATNTQVDIPGATVSGAGVFHNTAATYVEEFLTWPAFATYALKAGHKLGFVVSAADSNSNSVTQGQFFYGGGAPQYDTRFPVCFKLLTQSVTKSANKTVVDPTTAAPTNQITYTLTYQNPNSVSLTGVTISDPLPQGLTYVSSSPAAGTAPAVGANGTVIWNIGTVAAGATGSVSVTATVTDAVLGATTTNTVTLTSNEAPSKTASVVTQIYRPKPNVEIAKTASAIDHAPGSTFSYTVTVTNSGAGPAGSVVVTDTLPTYLSFNGAVTVSPVAGTISVVGSTLTYTLPSLAKESTATLTLPVQVAAVGIIPAGTTALTNTASVTDDYNTVPRTSTVDVWVTAAPAISLVQHVTAVSAPEGVRAVEILSGGAGYTSEPSITFGCTTQPTYTVQITAGAITGITITGYGSGCTSSEISISGGGATTPATAKAILGLFEPGETITYTLTVTNSGNADATGVVLADSVPTWMSWTSGGTFSGGSVSWSLGSIAPGATVTRTYTVTVSDGLPEGATPTETNATVTSTNTAGDSDTVEVRLFAEPMYTISKTPSGVVMGYPLTTVLSNASPTVVNVNSAALISVGDFVAFQMGPASYEVRKVVAKGNASITLDSAVTPPYNAQVLPALEFVLNYSNVGTAAGTNVQIVDVLPGQLRYAGVPPVPAPPAAVIYPAPTSAPPIGSSGSITWTLPSLPNGTTGSVKYYAFAAAAGVFTNTASISDGTPARTKSDTATNTFGALLPTKLTTTPSVNNTASGSVATYSISIVNPLPTAASNVTVTDVLPNGFTYKAGTTSGAGEPAGLASATDPVDVTRPKWWNLTVPGGGTLTFTFSVDIAASVPNGTYDNEILIGGAVSLEFDSLATNAEDVKVCNPPSPIVAPSVCPGFTGEAATDYFANASYNWTLTNATSGGRTFSVYKINVLSGGSGYTVAPAVTITGGGGTGAEAIAFITGDVVTSIMMTKVGSGYSPTTPPTVTIAAPTSGTQATAVAVIGEGILYTPTGTAAVVIELTVTRDGCVRTSSATAGVLVAPTVVKEQGDTVCHNSIAVFTANVAGADTFQWQLSTDGGTVWTNIANGGVYTGATTSTLTVDPATEPMSGYQYRLRAANANCTVTSSPVTLTVLKGGTCSAPDLIPSVTDTPDPVNAGDNITYTIDVANIGPGTANAVTLTIPIPANTTVVGTITPPADWTCAPPSGGQIVCQPNSGTMLTNVTSADFTLVLQVDPSVPHGSTITLNVIAATTDVEANTANNTATATTLVQRRVDLGVFKDNDAQVSGAGAAYDGYMYVGPGDGSNDTLTYTIRVTNGRSIRSLTVTEGGSGYTESPIVTIAPPAGGGVTATAAAIVDAGVVTSISIIDPGTGYTSSPAVTIAAPTTGTTATATAVRSASPSTASNVVVTDPLPEGFTYTSYTSTQGTCTDAPATLVTCSVGTMLPGAVVTITITGTVTVHTTYIENTATVSATETDTFAPNNSWLTEVRILAPTAVQMRSMEAVKTKSGVTVSWRTLLETDNLGFNVYRRPSAGGPLVKINNHMIPGSGVRMRSRPHVVSGFSYRVKDNPPAGNFEYYIEDLDLDGTRTMNGPLTPQVGRDEDFPAAPTEPDPSIGSVGGLLESPRGMGITPAGRTGPLAQRQNVQAQVAASAAGKIVVPRTGWIRVSRKELIAGGYDPGTNSRALAVFADGIEVPIEVNDGGDGKFDPNDTIEFFGSGVDTPTAGARIYYVVNDKGRGARVKANNGNSKGSAAPGSYPHTYWRKDRSWYFGVLLHEPDGENFVGPMVMDTPTSESLPVENLDPAGEAEIEIVLQGVTESVEHEVAVRINGELLGSVRFTGVQRAVFKKTFSASKLVEGENTVEYRSLNGYDDFNVVESKKLTYPHRFRADDGLLGFTAPSGTEVKVTGFSEKSIKAVDLTDEYEPVRLSVKVTAGANGTWDATLVTPNGSKPRMVLVYGESRVVAPAQIVANEPSAWSSMKNQADLVVITHRDFRPAATTLKKAREAEGIATAVVDVQNLYDEFSFGEHSPFAIRAFLEQTQRWQRAPKYVILLGDASYDPRNYWGDGTFDFVPSKTVSSSWGKTTADDWLADFDGDGVPSLAIGRIAVRTPEEAETVVAKLVQRKTAAPSGDWTDDVLLVSDVPDAGAPFDRSVSVLRQAVPPTMTTRVLEFGKSSNPTQAVIDGFNGGALLMTYVGHGWLDVWGRNVFGGWHVPQLNNAGRLPFVIALNCNNGMFDDTIIQSMAEALLNGENGAIGVVAGSLLTSTGEQAAFGRELMRNLLGGDRVGDAFRKAKGAVGDGDVRRTFILFGDPTMKLK